MEKMEEIRKLLSVLKRHDVETEMHSRRVMEMTQMFTKEEGEKEKELINTAALMHDIGKLYIPLEVLNKKGPLTPIEKTIVDQHALFSYKILSSRGFSKEVCCMVLFHHGNNVFTQAFQSMSDMLRDPLIKRGAGIISCCDIYDAMTSDRPYRKALPKESAIEAIMRNMFIPMELKVNLNRLTYAFA